MFTFCRINPQITEFLAKGLQIAECKSTNRRVEKTPCNKEESDFAPSFKKGQCTAKPNLEMRNLEMRNIQRS